MNNHSDSSSLQSVSDDSPAPLLAAIDPRPVELAVEASAVCRRYGRRWALVNVSFKLPRGSALMVAGRNGSGKSTLFRVLSTAIRADRGTARVAGFDIRSQRHDVRLRSALLGHYPGTYEALSAIENLRIFARLIGKDTSTGALLPLLEQVDLGERADDAISTFSAGMRKRLSIARTLLQDAEVLLIDEPYGQLDPPGFRFVDRLFRHFRDRGATVLMATHQLERGAALCDYGMVLEQGNVQWYGTARDLPKHGGLDPAGLPEGAV
jgi:heme exporter protein A